MGNRERARGAATTVVDVDCVPTVLASPLAEDDAVALAGDFAPLSIGRCSRGMEPASDTKPPSAAPGVRLRR